MWTNDRLFYLQFSYTLCFLPLRVFYIFFLSPAAALLLDAIVINFEDIKENLHVIPINTTT